MPWRRTYVYVQWHSQIQITKRCQLTYNQHLKYDIELIDLGPTLRLLDNAYLILLSIES